jgi:hypothetical protein
VYDRDYLKPDDLLGQLELPVKSIITWTQVRCVGVGARAVAAVRVPDMLYSLLLLSGSVRAASSIEGRCGSFPAPKVACPLERPLQGGLAADMLLLGGCRPSRGSCNRHFTFGRGEDICSCAHLCCFLEPLWLLQGGVRGMRDGWWRLRRKSSQPWDKASAGRIEMKVQFRPYNS